MTDVSIRMSNYPKIQEGKSELLNILDTDFGQTLAGITVDMFASSSAHIPLDEVRIASTQAT